MYFMSLSLRRPCYKDMCTIFMINILIKILVEKEFMLTPTNLDLVHMCTLCLHNYTNCTICVPVI